MRKHLHLFGALAAAVALAVPIAALSQEAPGTFKIPGTDTSLTLYGYVQVYGTYDLSSRPTPIEAADWATILPLQPLKGTTAAKETGQLYLTARTSRIGISTSTPTPLGALGTKVEGDFNGDASQTYTNSYRFRLRHAYGTLHGFLVGQTWTQFLDFASAPDTVDFNGPGTLALIRQAQVRYTIQPRENVGAAVSLENPANGTNGHAPDVILKAAYTPAWGSLGAGFVAMQYRFAKPTDAPDSEPNKHSTLGWGAQLSGSYKLGKDTLVAFLVGGDGVGRYVFNTLGTSAGGTPFGGFTDGGSFKLWRVLAYHVGYTHVWSDKLRSNVVWSQTFLDRNGISRASFTNVDGSNGIVPSKRIDQLFLNAFYDPVKNVELGFEYDLGRRHTYFSQTGYQDRVTVSATYKFF